MRFEDFSFGHLQIDGVEYVQDVVIDRGDVRLRKKKPSKRYRAEYGHTPLSVDEKIPWNCRQLVIGTGAEGGLPVMAEVLEEAERRGVRVLALPTAEALAVLARKSRDVNAVLHITC